MARGTRTQGGRRTRICACANCGRGRPLVILPRRAETSLCPTFTIAHVNATHPRTELDVVSVFCLRSKNLSPVCAPTRRGVAVQRVVLHSYQTVQPETARG